jgi:hypothetical protein
VRRTARLLASTAVIGVIATILPLVAASPASAARQKTIKISDASIVEGDSGQKTVTFTLAWTGAKGGSAVSVSYATADGTATAGSDYTAKSGVATFNNGCKCATVTVAVLGDTTTEGTETFFVNLSSPVNGVIGDGQAIATIYDNEGPPAFVVADGTADESAGTMSFTVLMTNASSGTKTVDYATADGTAVAGSDYTETHGTLTFTTGQTSKAVLVPIANDSLSEADETFTLNLSNASLALDDATAVGTIVDDDPEPTLTVADVATAETAGTLTFTITASTASGQEMDVDYATADGTATAGSDYTAVSGTAVIASGATTATVEVPIANDSVYEGDETLTLSLSGEYNAVLGTAQVTGTITDDEAVPTATIADASVGEGNTGSATATFHVTLSHQSAFTASAAWTTADGSATAGSDYTAASGTVSFAAGETAADITVDVLGDTAVEPNETFTVTLSTPSGLAIGTPTGTGTITDDDRWPTALTLKVFTTKTKVGAKGVLETATADAQVTVKLYKRKGGAWVAVGSPRTVSVTQLGDRDHDGKADAAYKASFKRPTKGTYKLTATFAGNATLSPSTTAATHKL